MLQDSSHQTVLSKYESDKDCPKSMVLSLKLSELQYFM